MKFIVVTIIIIIIVSIIIIFALLSKFQFIFIDHSIRDDVEQFLSVLLAVLAKHWISRANLTEEHTRRQHSADGGRFDGAESSPQRDGKRSRQVIFRHEAERVVQRLDLKETLQSGIKKTGVPEILETADALLRDSWVSCSIVCATASTAFLRTSLLLLGFSQFLLALAAVIAVEMTEPELLHFAAHFGVAAFLGLLDGASNDDARFRHVVFTVDAVAGAVDGVSINAAAVLGVVGTGEVSDRDVARHAVGAVVGDGRVAFLCVVEDAVVLGVALAAFFRSLLARVEEVRDGVLAAASVGASHADERRGLGKRSGGFCGFDDCVCCF